MTTRIWVSLITFIIPALLTWLGVTLDSPDWALVSKIAAGVLFVIGIIYIFLAQIKILARWVKSKFIAICNVIKRMKEANELLILKDKQCEKPAKWLYPVIEYIDLNRQGSAHNDNDVYVRFKIDSHLLFDVKEFYVFAKLCLASDTIHSNESNWYEIKRTSNAPIGQLAHCSFSDAIHLMGASAQEQTLLKWIQEFRTGKPILAMLKLGVKFKKDDKPIPENLNVLEGNGVRYIAPMNDYRME